MTTFGQDFLTITCFSSVQIGKGAKHTEREIKEARKAIREELIPKEAALRATRAETYYWNNVLKGARAKEKEKEEGKKKEKEKEKEKTEKGKGKEKKDKEENVVSWKRSAVEDATENIDISELIKSESKKHQVVFSGTDYGISKMSETCALR